MNTPNTFISIDRAVIQKGGLKKFIELSWHEIEPGKSFIPGWHIDAICEHLEAISRGELTRLAISIPPGCMKSLTACVFWRAWVWTFKPETKWIYASYSMALSRRDNLRMRRLIESEWYRQRFGEAFRPLEDNWGTAKFVSDRAARMSFSETLSAIRNFAFKYPHSMAHIIEQKANGSAIIYMLRDEIPSLEPVLPEGGKEARAHAVEGLWSAGRVLLPETSIAPRINDFVQEGLEFPSSINDDQVDAMTQALTWLRERVLCLKTFYKSTNNAGNISCFL